MDNKKIKIWEKHGILENAVLEQPLLFIDSFSLVH